MLCIEASLIIVLNNFIIFNILSHILRNVKCFKKKYAQIYNIFIRKTLNSVFL